MKLILATPYVTNLSDPNDLWAIIKNNNPDLEIIFVQPEYQHDRSRSQTSLSDWFDYWSHSKLIIKTARANNADIIVTAFPALAVCVGVRKRFSFLKIPILAWAFNLGTLHKGIKKTIAKFSLSAVNKFIVPSTAETITYSRLLDRKKQDFTFIRFRKQQIVEFQKKHSAKKYILSMGAANRDYETLVKAASTLDYAFIIVAPDRHKPNTALPTNITWLSSLSLEQCHRLYEEAAMSVIPIKDVDIASGQITIIESMMYKTPVLVTDSIGARDYIVDSRNGILLEPHSVQDLAKKIEMIWSNDSLREQYEQAGIRYVNECLSGNAISKDITKVIRAMLPD